MAAPTPASAANGITIDTTGGVIYQGGGNYSGFTSRARGIMIVNRSTNAVALLVNISGMHSPGEFIGLQPSAYPYVFECGNQSIGTVTVKADSSTCVIDWGVSGQ